MDEGNGRTVDYSYDPAGRLVEESIVDPVNGDRSISYSYDAANNRLTRDDSAEGLTDYSYDANDRLVQATLNGVSMDYRYDANGNTLSESIVGVDLVRYSWDAQNRLVGVDANADGVEDVTNVYNASGMRVGQVVDGVETRFLVDENRSDRKVIEEYRPNGAVEAYYVYGPVRISQTRGTDTSYFLPDALGTTRVLTDHNGNVSDTYDFDAFGRLISQTGVTENHFLFAGEQQDPLTGQYYLRARHMDTDSGRFLSRDEFPYLLTEVATIHRYAYAGNNPVNITDPSGNFLTLQQAMGAIVVNGIISAGLDYLFTRDPRKAAHAGVNAA